MNVFGKSARSWRKARKRGVSPIIATILLVAITVVLAAVLYVLISGLTHGPGSTPIGSAFTAGNPTPGTCTAALVTAHVCSTATDFTYTLTVESSTVSFGSVLFEVKTPAGAVYPNVGAAGFSVVTISGTAAAYEGLAAGAGLAMPTTWTTYTGTFTTSSPLNSLYTIVIDMGTATATTGTGLTFVALGTGSYSGTTSALSLP
jgi:flagellin-like protein